MAKPKVEAAIEIAEFTRETATFCVMGQSPLIMERMSEKVKFGLLCPAPKKNASERQASLKHNPLEEFRESAYQSEVSGNPTLLQMRATAFKGAMANAALEIPGAKKAQIGRLTYVPGEWIDIYGTPKMVMHVVRTADMNHTPDIRTHAIIPEWCAVLSISYVTPQLRQQAVANLLAAAGEFIGVGGFRPEKGKGSYGRFLLVEETDKDFRRIARIGRTQQIAALDTPQFYDRETEDLFKAYNVEIKRRGFKAVV